MSFNTLILFQTSYVLCFNLISNICGFLGAFSLLVCTFSLKDVSSRRVWYFLQVIGNFFFLIVYLRLCWVCVAARAFSSCRERGLLSSCRVQASCGGGSTLELVEHRLEGALASGAAAPGLSSCGPGLWSTGSVVVVHRLSCSMACGVLAVPRIEPTPALAGRFFTTEPPGKPGW